MSARLEAAMAAAHSAADAAFRQHGITPSGVVVNVTWRDAIGGTCAAGSRTEGAPALMAESLREAASAIDGGEQ